MTTLSPALTSTTDPSSEEWQKRLAVIIDTMRDMSLHNDPQQMVRAYGERIRDLIQVDRRVSLSRRGLSFPHYRITRSTTWDEEINPWLDRDRLPLLEGGLLATLLYSDQPHVFDDLHIHPDDPAADYLADHRSLLAIPMFEQGQAINMVVFLRKDPHAFCPEQVPDFVWRTSLFGRATSNLVLKDELQQAYQALDREMKVVGDIQRSLLPAQLPRIERMDLAAHYQPAQRAGGDYYDFFPLPEGKWGIFIADVSGHGTPAAVLMAITHSLMHSYPGPPTCPAAVLEHLNSHLAARYTERSGTFVTAFYGVYDPSTLTIRYANAGHNPPRLKRCRDGSLQSLDGISGLPLGIVGEASYREAVHQLQPGDQIIFYTDGISEAHNPRGEQLGIHRLDESLHTCSRQARALLDAVMEGVEAFTQGHPADDDRTLIVARIS